MANEMEIVATGLGRWLATYWLHSTLLVAMAWVGRRWIHNPALQEIIWKGSLVVGLFTATFHLSIPPLWNSTGLIPIPLQPSPSSISSEISDEIPNIYTVDTPTPVDPEPLTFPITLESDGYRFILGVWSIVVISGLVWLGWRYHYFYRRLGQRMLLQDGILYEQLLDLCQQTSVPVPPLSLTDARIPPVLLPHGEICLPRSVILEMPIAEKRGVLAHELAHRVRGDHYWLLLTQLLFVFFPFQLLNRLAQRELQKIAEHFSDAFALKALGTPLPLVNGLVRMATWISQDTLPVAAMAVRPSTLTERVQQLLQPQVFRPVSKVRLFSGMGAMVMMLLFITPPVSIATIIDGFKAHPLDRATPIPTSTPRATPSSGASLPTSPAPRRTPLVRPTLELPPVALWPIEGKITVQPSQYHMAIDIAGEVGSPIVAAWDGTVSVAGYDRTGYGYRVMLRHADGYETLYAHLQTLLVEKGDTVIAGEVIGTRGESGRTTGPTLHFEVRHNGVRVNPWNYLP